METDIILYTSVPACNILDDGNNVMLMISWGERVLILYKIELIWKHYNCQRK